MGTLPLVLRGLPPLEEASELWGGAHSPGDPTVCPRTEPVSDTVPNPPGTQWAAYNGNLSCADLIKCTKVREAESQLGHNGWNRFLF